MAWLRRHGWAAALTLAFLSLVLSFTGLADAARHALFAASSRPRPNTILLLGRDGKFPASAIPEVSNSKRLNGLTEQQVLATALRQAGRQSQDNTPLVVLQCPSGSHDMGTYCISPTLYAVPSLDTGKNNYFYATRSCAALGGYLPSAGELIGAANAIPLASVLTDDPATSTIDQDPSDGLTDLREMSSTLVTTAAGSSAAGSEGVSVTATGDPRSGQPNPTPASASPQPDTLQYVTVYDNGQKGGFAGSEPVSSPENFRCAFGKTFVQVGSASGSRRDRR